MLAALGLGLLVVLRAKGTRRHKIVGRAYVGAMLLLNVTGLMIYDLYENGLVILDELIDGNGAARAAK